MMIIMMMKPSWHLEDLREDTPMWQEVIKKKVPHNFFLKVLN